MSALADHSFVKMNGLGNEIVVVDMRAAPTAVTAEDARAAARPGGVAYDQLMALGGRYRTMFDLQAMRFAENAEPEYDEFGEEVAYESLG